MATVGEVIDGGTFASQIEDTNLLLQSRSRPRFSCVQVGAHLRVGDTTIVPRLRVRLVLAVTVAASWTTTHYYCEIDEKSVIIFQFWVPLLQRHPNPSSVQSNPVPAIGRFKWRGFRGGEVGEHTHIV